MATSLPVGLCAKHKERFAGSPASFLSAGRERHSSL
jgi:hypothetical protein